MTSTVFILNFVKLSLLDYATIFSCFSWIIKVVGLESYYFGAALSVLYVFIVVLTVYKIRLKKLNGNLFYVWFTFILTAVFGIFFSVIFGYVQQIGYSFDSNTEKLLVWGIAAFIIIVLILVFIYGIKRLFHKRFDDINRMGKAYPKIERFFIYNSLTIILLVMLFHCGYRISGGSETSLQLLNVFLFFALIIQLSFLIMIFRITWLRDNLQNKAIENQSLIAYSSSLEKNMDEIRNIKHDIKNIFLTMGNFVEQSGDSKMQAFYREKISPFAADEIAKSDLYGKLAAIDNEQLKAFLFYKISQAIGCGITLELDISPDFVISKSKMEFADLIRVLGILLDNAIEECMEIENAVLVIKISQNDELVSYMVKNNVRHEIKENGLKSGVSTKGNGRGKGLIIGRCIIEKYDFATLNSYFQNGCFVQNFILYFN
jgi:hypothetical protein